MNIPTINFVDFPVLAGMVLPEFVCVSKKSKNQKGGNLKDSDSDSYTGNVRIGGTITESVHQHFLQMLNHQSSTE